MKAKIVFNNRSTTVDCVIKNLSRVGAKIAVGTAVSLPSEFDLEIPLKGKTYRALMRWRDAEAIGVEFVDAINAKEPGNAQYQRLEAENARLKAAILALSKKLEDLGQDVPNFF